MNDKLVADTAIAALEKIAERVPHGERTVTNTPRPPVQITGYEELERILKLAYNQAATGKGKERHSKQSIGFQPWDKQPILQIARMVGTGGHAYQVQKKVQEAVTMQGNGNFAGAKAEVLGAIVYAAAMYKLLEEIEDVTLNDLL